MAVVSDYPTTSPLVYGMVKLLEAAMVAGKEDIQEAILKAMRGVGTSPEKLATIQLVGHFKMGDVDRARSLLKEVS